MKNQLKLFCAEKHLILPQAGRRFLMLLQEKTRRAAAD